MTGKVSLLLLLSSLMYGVFAKDHVPVLIWNTKQAQSGLPAVPALQYINYSTFQAKYLDPFKPRNILLFLQDALSVEDLSSHPSELHHVKQWMESSHSLYLPNVENAAYLAHDLPSHGYNVVVLEPGVPAAGLDLKQQDNNLVVVKLPSTLTNPSRHRALQKADEVMENVISKIGEQRDFTFIFTGLKPSVEEHSEQFEERIRVARSSMPSEERSGGFHNASCVKINLLSDIVLIYKGSNSTENVTEIAIDDSNAAADSGDCSGDTARILIKYINVPIGSYTAAKVNFHFEFKKEGGQWMLEGVDNSIDDKKTYFKPAKPYVSGIPIGMSYSCAQAMYFKLNETHKTPEIQMKIGGVQMQAFSPAEEKFGGAWDCVGFFTVPIWVGLLTSLFYVFILSVGMYMLSDIKTMDRFDDPKGQPIMVPNTD
ncbi:V-type proton ATPase subunit S1-like [Panulirus ornatus]|uniref:V-type proton ATPase subunit S1-like n=1 Tax=Panulirus ornatus TaxID=150431 RepID=UPI003A83D8CC